MKRFILTLQFLTRIPIQVNLHVTEEDFREGMIYFPLVGFIIGLFVALAYYIGDFLGGALLASIMAVAFEVFITGGLHLDGLGDTFDGIYSNRPKDRILEIMKDSRLGTNAALVIFLTILLKIGLIQSLDGKIIYPVLVLMPVYARLSLVYGARFSNYARESGMGNSFIGKIHNKHLILAILFTLFISMINIWSIPFIILGYGFSMYYIGHITKKIGGMTGDTLGSLCELSELVYLFYFAIVISLGR